MKVHFVLEQAATGVFLFVFFCLTAHIFFQNCSERHKSSLNYFLLCNVDYFMKQWGFYGTGLHITTKFLRTVPKKLVKGFIFCSIFEKVLTGTPCSSFCFKLKLGFRKYHDQIALIMKTCTNTEIAAAGNQNTIINETATLCYIVLHCQQGL